MSRRVTENTQNRNGLPFPSLQNGTARAYAVGMNFVRLHIVFALLILTPALHAGDANQQNQQKAFDHAKLLEKLYPTPALQVLTQTDTPHEAYQAAVNAAYRAGVPASILNECVATRAMLKGDAAALKRLLPALKAGLEKYTEETSMFVEKAGAESMVKSIETALLEEERSPGAVVRRAKQAGEMVIARKIRAQLVSVDAMVDMQAIDTHLAEGAPVTEAQWRSRAKPGSYFATTGVDELGNPFGAQTAGKPPTVPKASYDRLKAVVPDSFWHPFSIPK